MWSIRILFLLSLTFSLGSVFPDEQNEDENDVDDSQEIEEEDGDEGREQAFRYCGVIVDKVDKAQCLF